MHRANAREYCSRKWACNLANLFILNHKRLLFPKSSKDLMGTDVVKNFIQAENASFLEDSLVMLVTERLWQTGP